MKNLIRMPTTAGAAAALVISLVVYGMMLWRTPEGKRHNDAATKPAGNKAMPVDSKASRVVTSKVVAIAADAKSQVGGAVKIESKSESDEIRAAMNGNGFSQAEVQLIDRLNNPSLTPHDLEDLMSELYEKDQKLTALTNALHFANPEQTHRIMLWIAEMEIEPNLKNDLLRTGVMISAKNLSEAAGPDREDQLASFYLLANAYAKNSEDDKNSQKALILTAVSDVADGNTRSMILARFEKQR